MSHDGKPETLLMSIYATPEMRDGKPYCPGCDGGCRACSPSDTANDVHVMPNYGAVHESKCRCWCEPELDMTADDGSQVWVHRDMN